MNNEKRVYTFYSCDEHASSAFKILMHKYCHDIFDWTTTHFYVECDDVRVSAFLFVCTPETYDKIREELGSVVSNLKFDEVFSSF